jgi:beta-phosphoglucomutase
MALRAIVFDFDGVIANSEPLHYRGYRDVLAAEGIALAERDYYARYLGFDDVGAFEAIGRSSGVTWDHARIEELVARKAVRLEELERDVSVLFPGAGEVVRRAAAVVPIAIASGARRDEIVRVLTREQLSHCFTVIVGAEDTLVSKPAPDPYLHAVTLLSRASNGRLKPSECVAIEDSHWGLESARIAGLRTVAVTNTYSADELTADLTIASLSDIDLDRLARLCSD